MGATIIIDIVHTHAEEPDGVDKMLVVARGMIDPNATCEHEMVVMALLVERTNELQEEVMQAAAKIFADTGLPLDHEEDTGETFH